MPENGAGNLPAVEGGGERVIFKFAGELVDVLPAEIVANVVVAGAVVAREIARKRRENAARGKLQEAPVGNGIHAAAEGVIELAHQAMADALHGGELQAVVVAVGAGRELRDRGEARIAGMKVRKGSKATGADGLVAVDLREIRLIDGSCADVLRFEAGGGTELSLEAETPLHEVWRVEFSGGNRGDVDGWKAGGGIREWGSAGEQALRKAGGERLVRGDGGVDGAVRHSGSQRGAADGAEQAALKCLDVGRISSDNIGDGAG